MVTGSLGAAAGGLIVARSRRHDAGTEWGRELLAALSRPVARVGEGQTLGQFGATAMIDVSDGLFLDLKRLCVASARGVLIRQRDVPVHPALRELTRVQPDVDPFGLATEGGEDFELIATLPEDRVGPAAATMRERFGTPLTDIGEILESPALAMTGSDGEEHPLEPRGWDHFA